MKLTKEQKIEVLEKAKILLTDSTENYICRSVETASNNSICFRDTFIVIPELLKHKPKNILSEKLWFMGYNSYRLIRIEIIEKTINDIKNS